MYFPYFRGKQNELITIRNNASLMAQAGFVPIIEPVKETLNGLKRALDSVVNSKGRAIVIVNPFHGDYSKNGDSLTNLLADHFDGEDGISAGILLTNEISLEAAISSCKAHEQHSLTLIHAGFAYARELSNALGDKVKDVMVSSRLTDSPSCIVSDSSDPSAQMQKIFQQMGQTGMPEAKPILEINSNHKIVKKLNKMSKTKLFNDTVMLLYDQALLAENVKLSDPNEFINRLNRALEKSL